MFQMEEKKGRLLEMGLARGDATPQIHLSQTGAEMICRFLVLCAVLAVVSGFRALPSSGRMGK